MTSDNTFELFGPLANSIRKLLVREWNPCRINQNAISDDLYDDYIPAIHKLAIERYASPEDDIEHIAAYLSFVTENCIGENPDKDLNQEVAEKIFAMAEAARQKKPQFA